MTCRRRSFGRSNHSHIIFSKFNKRPKKYTGICVSADF